MEDRPFELSRIYTARDTKELAERYAQMAENYDESIQADWGWTPPDYVTGIFAKYVDNRARILDAGAGTGLVGEALVRRGYRNIVAIDIAEAMLVQARGKGIYREVHRMELGQPLTFPLDHFDAVVSVGVMTKGHAPVSSLDELVRITKPGGYIVYTLRPDWYQPGGFHQKHIVLEESGKWEFLERTEPFMPMPKREPDVFFEVWVFQVV